MTKDELVLRGYIKDPNILKRHRITIGLIGLGGAVHFLGNFLLKCNIYFFNIGYVPVAYICYFVSSFNILRVENVLLRTQLLYESVLGNKDHK